MSFNKENSGTMSANRNKLSDKHPDYKGKAQIDGVEYWVSAWVKKNEGGTFLSLAFDRKADETFLTPVTPAVEEDEVQAELPKHDNFDSDPF